MAGHGSMIALRTSDFPRETPSQQPLEEFLRAHMIDNFEIDGGLVRIGSRVWQAHECRCGVPGCDGWEMVPIGC